jgi:voltage-dependent calcium channel T type alpha-1G
MTCVQDTLRDDCEANDSCMTPIVAPLFFVVFVLMAQFVLINVVVAVLMKHLEVSSHKLHNIGITSCLL